jgi:hypothetical protein
VQYKPLAYIVKRPKILSVSLSQLISWPTDSAVNQLMINRDQFHRANRPGKSSRERVGANRGLQRRAQIIAGEPKVNKTSQERNVFVISL